MGTGPALAKTSAPRWGLALHPDEFDREDAHLEARIDGEVWSSGKVGAMHFSFEELIEWTSQEQTLWPGDLLGSGTVGGGCGLELGRWIQRARWWSSRPMGLVCCATSSVARPPH